MIKNGYKEWTWTCGGVSRTHYFIRQYYMKDFLLKSASERKSSCNTSKILQEDMILTQGPGGNLLRTSADVTEMRSNSDFTQQACIYWMGTHYYYNMSKTTECTAEGIYPWFLLVHGDNGEKQSLIGCAMMTFGKMSSQCGSRDWYENPPTFAVKKIVNNGPQCLYDYSETGVITMHIYFVRHPDKVYC